MAFGTGEKSLNNDDACCVQGFIHNVRLLFIMIGYFNHVRSRSTILRSCPIDFRKHTHSDEIYLISFSFVPGRGDSTFCLCVAYDVDLCCHFFLRPSCFFPHVTSLAIFPSPAPHTRNPRLSVFWRGPKPLLLTGEVGGTDVCHGDTGERTGPLHIDQSEQLPTIVLLRSFSRFREPIHAVMTGHPKK